MTSIIGKIITITRTIISDRHQWNEYGSEIVLKGKVTHEYIGSKVSKSYKSDGYGNMSVSNQSSSSETAYIIKTDEGKDIHVFSSEITEIESSES